MSTFHSTKVNFNQKTSVIRCIQIKLKKTKILDGWTRDSRLHQVKFSELVLPRRGSSVSVYVTYGGNFFIKFINFFYYKFTFFFKALLLFIDLFFKFLFQKVNSVSNFYVCPDMSQELGISYDKLRYNLDKAQERNDFKPFSRKPDNYPGEKYFSVFSRRGNFILFFFFLFAVIGDYVLALRKEKIHRCEVVDYVEYSNFIVLKFVDTGIIASVEISDLFEWDQQFSYIPRLAYHCGLENVRVDEQDKKVVNEKFRELVLGKQMMLEFV